MKNEIIDGLRHAARWIKGEPHDDSCDAIAGKRCDCGKVLAYEQVRDAALKIAQGDI